MSPSERILAAIELNPDRSRVTIRRDDARQLLADNQRLAADVELYKTGCIRLEAMHAERCTTIQGLVRSRESFRTLADQRRREALPLIHPLAHMPYAWALYVTCAFGGWLAHG